MAQYTPMMQQYLEIKKQHKYSLLFFRLGDFYELFFEDAKIASRELEITLTGKDCGQAERAPMCGVPYHAAEGYISRLVEKGYQVAICEQVEDPKTTKKIVKREVVRVVTPGTVLDTNVLDEGRNNYIMCLYNDKNGIGVAVSDVSTGELLTTQISRENETALIDEIAKYMPSQIISNGNSEGINKIDRVFNLKTSAHSEWAFDYDTAYKTLCAHFKVLNLNAFDLGRLSVCACGALIDYLLETQKNSLSHISGARSYTNSVYMTLDMASRRNLEITQTIRDKTKKGSLLWVLDKTKTSMGKRLLRKWVEQPLLDTQEINDRLDSVSQFKNDPLTREELKELLNTVYDIERLLGKIIYKTANARDLIMLKCSLQNLPFIKKTAEGLDSARINALCESFDTLDDIFRLIDAAIADDPPFSVREGDIVKTGFNEEVDKLRRAKNEGGEWIAKLEAKEKEATGIKNLKIRYNKVFGYYIEITNSYKELAPDTYIRKQTLSNCERFITPELKEIEETILTASEKISTLEFEIFSEVRDTLSDNSVRIQTSAGIIAELDVLNSLGEVADKQNYVKPVVNDGDEINIVNGRHPVVEKMLDVPFIPNSTYLDAGDDRFSIITGPNMAGKSTYMRQVALLVLMAQIGSFVPADEAVVGVCDRIFTRVGASDDLATGQSTFMMEMTEVSHILNYATNKSLIILDEIGRGTSTFDGLSIAWAIVEYIADRELIGARTLFATHYHELTELEGKVNGVKNYCVAVVEQNDDVIFLHKIERGGANKSYGINVAKLAGVPEAVISRSKKILSVLDQNDILRPGRTEPEDDRDSEVVYYTTRKNKNTSIIIDEIIALDMNSMTPLEAFSKLQSFKDKVAELYD